MTPAWYMKFHEGQDINSLDRVGGLPTHLLEEWPTLDGEPMVFIAQFSCHAERLPFSDTLAIQIYQEDPDNGCSEPYIYRMPLDAPKNAGGIGHAYEGPVPHAITWEYREDPEAFDFDADDWERQFESKPWGCPTFPDILENGQRFFMHLNEEPAGLNFGGDELLLAIDSDENVIWTGA
ncbi:MAG: hypothetical protein AAF483_29080 [Planctomycetota bacterium]